MVAAVGDAAAGEPFSLAAVALGFGSVWELGILVVVVVEVVSGQTFSFAALVRQAA